MSEVDWVGHGRRMCASVLPGRRLDSEELTLAGTNRQHRRGRMEVRVGGGPSVRPWSSVETAILVRVGCCRRGDRI